MREVSRVNIKMRELARFFLAPLFSARYNTKTPSAVRHRGQRRTTMDANSVVAVCLAVSVTVNLLVGYALMRTSSELVLLGHVLNAIVIRNSTGQDGERTQK